MDTLNMKRRETLTIFSDPNNIVAVDEWAERIAEDMGFDEGDRDDIAISVTEAVNNAIVHGNDADPQKRVVIELLQENGEVRVSVQDEGRGFDLDEVPDPTIPENLMKPFGRGIHIIQRLMDDVWIDRFKSGCRITMIKRRKKH
jgi:serine/threonine-protein kinase RsbW